MGSQTACDGGACTSGAVGRRVRARLTCQPWGSSWKELPPLLASPLPLTGQGLELCPALIGASGSPACLSSVWRHSSGPLPHAGEDPSPRPWGSWTPDCAGPAQASPGCPGPRPQTLPLRSGTRQGARHCPGGKGRGGVCAGDPGLTWTPPGRTHRALCRLQLESSSWRHPAWALFPRNVCCIGQGGGGLRQEECWV